MKLRLLKVVLIVLVALQGLLYALQNLVNLDAAFQAVAFSLSQSGHQLYPAGLLPSIQAPVLVGAVLAVIILIELLVGLTGLFGAWRMSRELRASPEAFHQSKEMAVVACGLAIAVWFGMFMVGGSAGLQMWQTEAGAGAVNGAFTYAAMSALILLIVQQPEIPC